MSLKVFLLKIQIKKLFFHVLSQLLLLSCKHRPFGEMMAGGQKIFDPG